MKELIRLSGLVGFVAVLLGTTASRASAGFIYASGQRLIENEPGTHDDLRENRIYRIDTATGLAVPASPATSGLPAALAGAPDGRLLGFSGGRLQVIDPSTGVVTPAGPTTGLNSTGFEVTAGGQGFLAPFNADFETQQLHRIDLTTSGVRPLGSPTAIGDAIDAAFGLEAGTSEPFLIGLGSVGSSIYGVNLESGRTNLIAINETTGVASVVGARDAVGGAFGGLYSGFAAMTGVDEDGDGRYDALFGGVNFFDHDADRSTAVQRLGGVARYNLGDGTYSLVGTNPGVIFFGFGSTPVPVPEPGGLALFAIGLLGAAGLRLHRARRGGRGRRRSRRPHRRPKLIRARGNPCGSGSASRREPSWSWGVWPGSLHSPHTRDCILTPRWISPVRPARRSTRAMTPAPSSASRVTSPTPATWA